MRFSDATGRKVVSTSTAETVGVVDGFVVDPVSRVVAGLKVKGSHGSSLVLWSQLIAFGSDAVTVASAEELEDAAGDLAERSDSHHQLLGKRVLSAAGDELGVVRDVAFDPETAQITELLLGHSDVPGVRLLGVGSYAVVVATA